MRSLFNSFDGRSLASSRTDGAGMLCSGKNARVKAFFLSVTLLFFLLLLAGSAHAATQSPGWRMDAITTPTNFSASAADTAECLTGGGTGEFPCDAYEVYATNAGSEPTDGSPVTLTDTLPQGVTVKRVELFLVTNGNTIRAGTREYQKGIGGETVNEGECPRTVPVRCTFNGTVAPNAWLWMRVYVTVNEGVAGSLTNHAQV